LTEKIFLIDQINPLRFFGPDNKTLNHIKNSFPGIRIVSRGNMIKATGPEDLLERFGEKLEQMIRYLEEHPEIEHEVIDKMMRDEWVDVHPELTQGDQVLVYGPGGKSIKARTPNQKLLVYEIERNDIVFALGPAGTGKTYTAVAVAVRALKNKQVKRIILARPAVEAGENLGFLPGDMKDKIDPYLRPLYDALEDMLPPDKFIKYMENRTIEIAPMAFMRGRTLDHCFVILDEAQNATDTQLKMFLTRMGPNAKIIVTGDLSQVDLPRNQKSGLIRATRILGGIPGIRMVYLDVEDVVRHRLVKKIITAYEKSDERSDLPKKLPAKEPTDHPKSKPTE
jgi:phosphate starvation-inducible PhoH-like protein